jgi:hypothetical protein
MSKLVLSFSFIFLLTLLASCSIEPAKIESFMSPEGDQEDFLDEQDDKEDKPEEGLRRLLKKISLANLMNINLPCLFMMAEEEQI